MSPPRYTLMRVPPPPEDRAFLRGKNRGSERCQPDEPEDKMERRSRLEVQVDLLTFNNNAEGWWGGRWARAWNDWIAVLSLTCREHSVKFSMSGS